MVINNPNANAEKELKDVKIYESKIQPQPVGMLPCDLGLLELENENYTDLKNYFNSKTNRLFISINLEHEDIQELNNTLCSILNNLNYLNRKIQLNQNEVSIIIIADGISSLHTDFKKLLFNSETIMADNLPPPVENVNDYMHCFRAIYGDSEYQQNPNPFRKLDLMFVVKEKNTGIINSHMCFFNGFLHSYRSKENPESVYALLTTAGTFLDFKAMNKCYGTMEAFPETSAVTGQLDVNLDSEPVLSFLSGRYLDNKLNSMYDQHLESCLGHVNNISESFSFFKSSAITNEFIDVYFKYSQFEQLYLKTPYEKVVRDYSGKFFSSNLFLTQNTLSVIKYVPDAIAKVNSAYEYVLQTIETTHDANIPKNATSNDAKANNQNLSNKENNTLISKKSCEKKVKTYDLASYLHDRRSHYNSKLMSTLHHLSIFCSVWQTPHLGITKFGLCVISW